jgi:hypothetical protein
LLKQLEDVAAELLSQCGVPVRVEWFRREAPRVPAFGFGPFQNGSKEELNPLADGVV